MDDPSLEQLLEDAREAIRRRDQPRSISLTDQLVAALPADPRVRVLHARALLQSGVGEEALEESRRAVGLAPDSHEAHALLGVAAWRMDRLTLAQQSLEKAVELSGGQPGPWADYAWFMAFERGPKLAEEAAREAVAVGERSSTAWAALGLAQVKLHRRQEAETSLGRALELDPNDPYAQFAMAIFLQDERLDRKAVALARLLRDTAGTDELVEAVQRRAKLRQVDKLLVERGAGPRATGFDSRYVHAAAILLALAAIVALCLLVRPQTSAAWFTCFFLPLLGYWFFRLVFD